MAPRDTEPRYVISIAARMVGIETHTLRYYERIGLIRPHRSKGKIRYYSESDIQVLRQIKTLTDDLGISPAGVEVVLRMAEQMLDMKRRLRDMESRMKLLEEATQDSECSFIREEEE